MLNLDVIHLYMPFWPPLLTLKLLNVQPQTALLPGAN